MACYQSTYPPGCERANGVMPIIQSRYCEDFGTNDNRISSTNIDRRTIDTYPRPDDLEAYSDIHDHYFDFLLEVATTEPAGENYASCSDSDSSSNFSELTNSTDEDQQSSLHSCNKAFAPNRIKILRGGQLGQVKTEEDKCRRVMEKGTALTNDYVLNLRSIYYLWFLDPVSIEIIDTKTRKNLLIHRLPSQYQPIFRFKTNGVGTLNLTIKQEGIQEEVIRLICSPKQVLESHPNNYKTVEALMLANTPSPECNVNNQKRSHNIILLTARSETQLTSLLTQTLTTLEFTLLIHSPNQLLFTKQGETDWNVLVICYDSGSLTSLADKFKYATEIILLLPSKDAERNHIPINSLCSLSLGNGKDIKFDTRNISGRTAPLKEKAFLGDISKEAQRLIMVIENYKKNQRKFISAALLNCTTINEESLVDYLVEIISDPCNPSTQRIYMCFKFDHSIVSHSEVGSNLLQLVNAATIETVANGCIAVFVSGGTALIWEIQLKIEELHRELNEKYSLNLQSVFVACLSDVEQLIVRRDNRRFRYYLFDMLRRMQRDGITRNGDDKQFFWRAQSFSFQGYQRGPKNAQRNHISAAHEMRRLPTLNPKRNDFIGYIDDCVSCDEEDRSTPEQQVDGITSSFCSQDKKKQYSRTKHAKLCTLISGVTVVCLAFFLGYLLLFNYCPPKELASFSGATLETWNCSSVQSGTLSNCSHQVFRIPKLEHYKLLPDAKGVVYGRLTAELKSRLNSTFTIQFQAVQIGVHIVLNNQTIVKDYRHNSTITKTITLHAHEKNNIYVEFYSLRQDRNISLSFKEILNGNEPNGFCTQSPEGGTLVELKEDILIDAETQYSRGKFNLFNDIRRLNSHHNSSLQDDTLGRIISNQIQRRLPGIEHLEVGVDITSGKEAPFSLLQFDNDYNSMNSLQDTYRETIYTIPEDIKANPLPKCTFNVDFEMFDTPMLMQTELAARFVFHRQDLHRVYLSEEESVIQAFALAKNASGSVLVTEIVCATAQARLNKYSFHQEFLDDLASVETVSNVTPLFRKYGTHYYKSATLGGKLKQITVLDGSYQNTKSEIELKQHAVVSLMSSISAPYGSSFSTNVAEASQNDYARKSVRSSIITYGGPPGAFGPSSPDAPTSFGDWASNIDLLPVPIEYELVPINVLIPEHWKTKNGKSIKQLWQEASERHLEKQHLDYCRQNEYNSDMCEHSLLRLPGNCFVDSYHRIPMMYSPEIASPSSFGIDYYYDALGNYTPTRSQHLPGIEHMQHGFDILKGEESSHHLFYFRFCDEKSLRTVQDIYREKIYTITEDLYAQPLPKCTLSVNSLTFSSTLEMAQVYLANITTRTDVTVELYKDSNLAFSEEVSIKIASELEAKFHGSFIVSDVKCGVTQLKLVKHTFHPSFLEDVRQSKSIDDIAKLVSKYGTHVYSTTTLGGKLRKIMVVKKQLEREEQKLEDNASLSLKEFVSGATYEFQTKDGTVSFRKPVIFYGGSPVSFNPDRLSTLRDWVDTLDSLPVPIDYTLTPVHDIIPASWVINLSNGTAVKLRLAWIEGVTHYVQQHKKKSS